MNTQKFILSPTLIFTSILALGTLSANTVMASSQMPPGYVLSPTQLKGKHCYRHNNEPNLYCYPYKLTPDKMMKQNSMMKKDDAMMKKDDSMMKKDDAMMKKDDSMMKKDDSMMQKEESMKK
jgi:hypothetical protein